MALDFTYAFFDGHVKNQKSMAEFHLIKFFLETTSISNRNKSCKSGS